MSEHGLAWYQDVYLPSSWTCVICQDDGPNDFHHQEELYTHIRDAHNFNEKQLAAIVHLSKRQARRRPEICPLCCLRAEGDPETLPKRVRRNGGADEGINPIAAATNDKNQPAEVMARHVASHLQVLMFLTIRLMSTHDNDKDSENNSVASSEVDTGDNLTREMQSQSLGIVGGSEDGLRDSDRDSEHGTQLEINSKSCDIPDTAAGVDWSMFGLGETMSVNSYTSSTATWQLQRTLEGHYSSVRSVAFSHDSKLLASGSGDKTIRVWDAAS